jgi:mRNA interferase MazF
MQMNKGDIYWVDILARNPSCSKTPKARPCVVIGISALNTARSTVVTVPLSSNNKAHPPISVRVRSAGATSVAICDQLLAVDKTRIKQLAGKVTTAELEELDQSLWLLLRL